MKKLTTFSLFLIAMSNGCNIDYPITPQPDWYTSENMGIADLNGITSDWHREITEQQINIDISFWIQRIYEVDGIECNVDVDDITLAWMPPEELGTYLGWAYRLENEWLIEVSLEKTNDLLGHRHPINTALKHEFGHVILDKCTNNMDENHSLTKMWENIY